VITETSAVAFRQNLGEMLNIVQYRNDSIVIKKDGKPVAALIDARLFERIRRMQDRFDALCNRLEQDFAKVPEAEGTAAIDAAVSAVRKEMKAEAATQASSTTPRASKPRPPGTVKPATRSAKTSRTRTHVR
jgi:prevent-host-death family protein